MEYYDRDRFLSSSEAKSDDVIYDFIGKFDCKYIVWFNAITPLQTKEDITGFVEKLIIGQYQSLFSTKTDFIQALFENSPVIFLSMKNFKNSRSKTYSIFYSINDGMGE